MAIDLSILISGASTATGTISPIAMYKKLQKLSEENEANNAPDAASEQAKATIRDFNNAAIRVRNAQFRDNNAQVVNDATYYANRVRTANTATELVNDDRFLGILAQANGYQDLFRTDKTKLRAILLSDLTDPNSVARKGTLKDIELAKKYNFALTGNLIDANGKAVGLDANRRVTNAAADIVTPLPNSLAKLRGVAVDVNNIAVVTPTHTPPKDGDGSLINGPDIVAADTSAYKTALTRPLLSEEKAPTVTKKFYEFEGQEFETFKERSDIKNDVEYYKQNIGDVKSLDDLFKNHRLFTFILSAYDLDSDAQFPGKIRKIIESDLADPNSLANRFQDPRYQQLAKDISFSILGTTKLTLGSTTEDMVKKFQQVSYEKHLDQQAPGVRAAIEFGRRIKDVSQTIQLLGDSVLREVVTVGNNIPKELAFQETASQITALEKKVDVNSLKNDPNEIEKLITRYLTFKDAGASNPNSYLLNLFG